MRAVAATTRTAEPQPATTPRLAVTQIAATVSSVTGRPVRYEELTPEAWHKELVAGSAKLGGEPNVRAADHLVAQSVAGRPGEAEAASTVEGTVRA